MKVRCPVHGIYEQEEADQKKCPWPRGIRLRSRRYLGHSPGRCSSQVAPVPWQRDMDTNIVHDLLVPTPCPEPQLYRHPDQEEIERKIASGEWKWCPLCIVLSDPFGKKEVPDADAR